MAAGAGSSGARTTGSSRLGWAEPEHENGFRGGSVSSEVVISACAFKILEAIRARFLNENQTTMYRVRGTFRKGCEATAARAGEEGWPRRPGPWHDDAACPSVSPPSSPPGTR